MKRLQTFWFKCGQWDCLQILAVSTVLREMFRETSWIICRIKWELKWNRIRNTAQVIREYLIIKFRVAWAKVTVVYSCLVFQFRFRIPKTNDPHLFNICIYLYFTRMWNIKGKSLKNATIMFHKVPLMAQSLRPQKHAFTLWLGLHNLNLGKSIVSVERPPSPCHNGSVP